MLLMEVANASSDLPSDYHLYFLEVIVEEYFKISFFDNAEVGITVYLIEI